MKISDLKNHRNFDVYFTHGVVAVISGYTYLRFNGRFPGEPGLTIPLNLIPPLVPEENLLV